MKKYFLPAILFCLLAGCEKIDTSVENNTPNLRILTEGEKSVIASTNQFAFNLWNQVNASDPGKNNFISPLSVAYALAMTYNGASGETKTAIGDVLDFDSRDPDSINASYESLTAFLFSLDNSVKLNIANSIWYRDDLHVKKSFTDLVIEYYDAKVDDLNFKDPASKDIINAWIEDETNGKIRDMLDKIPDDAVMYLVNAIYFKSAWTYRFDKSLTQKGDFFLENGEKIQVDMMHSKGVKFSYYNDGEITLIDIPYGNGQYALSVILPAGDRTLDELSNSINADNYNTWIQEADTMTKELVFPKFSLEYKSELKEPLTNMGMGIAFSDRAEFPELFEEETLPLAISRVMHQARLDINEEGTEAAAATIVEIVYVISEPGPQPILINRPFLFIIHEKHSNSILFCGKLLNPLQ